MLILMIVALYAAGKEAGNFDLLYDFLILVTAIAYIVSVFCVSYDAEVRGVSVFLVSMFCCFLPIITHIVWLFVRPEEKYSFEDYIEFEESLEEKNETK